MSDILQPIAEQMRIRKKLEKACSHLSTSRLHSSTNAAHIRKITIKKAPVCRPFGATNRSSYVAEQVVRYANCEVVRIGADLVLQFKY